jgi:uncharacterized protein HemX
MSLLAQQEKYDAAAVEADIANLQRELDDETQIASTLQQDSAQTLSNLQEWVGQNADRVRDQHKRMLVLTQQLKTAVAKNVSAESSDAALNEYLNSDASNELANLLTELRAMSDEYKQLLLDTGRNGRPPLF